MEKALHSAEVKDLLNTILQLSSIDEAQKFFRDLLTKSELEEFATRWQIAKMLHKKIPYTTIETQTGVSSTTIARISKWLQEGEGGYRLMLEKLEE